MTAETNELLRRMEQATSVTPVDPGELDDETALLRENWLAFGKLLKDADAGAEKSERTEVVALRRSSDSPHRLWRVALFGGTVALAIVGWLVLQPPDNADQGPSVAIRAEWEKNSVLSGAANAAVQSADASAIEFAWDDDWDSDLAQTALAFKLFRGEQPARDSMAYLQGEFQELARDFESGSL